MRPPTADVTRLLQAWGGGDKAALDRLAPLVYEELHRIAHRHVQRQRPGITLQATALVNEAFLRLVDISTATWEDRAHFFGFCAQTMRRILVDAARARGAGKRGGGVLKFSLEESIDIAPERDNELVALDDALGALAEQDPRAAKVVEMRFFGGLSVEETAEALRISPRSAAREWEVARAWLMRELSR
jgi:RNA polymerase sigma-70 factor, ECF subfamily